MYKEFEIQYEARTPIAQRSTDLIGYPFMKLTKWTTNIKDATEFISKLHPESLKRGVFIKLHTNEI